jgi:hypothetical protein
VGALAACPAFDQNSHAVLDAQDGDGIDSVRPEPGSPLDSRGQFVPCSQRPGCPCVLRVYCVRAVLVHPSLGRRKAKSRSSVSILLLWKQIGTLVPAFADFFSRPLDLHIPESSNGWRGLTVQCWLCLHHGLSSSTCFCPAMADDGSVLALSHLGLSTNIRFCPVMADEGSLLVFFLVSWPLCQHLLLSSNG